MRQAFGEFSRPLGDDDPVLIDIFVPAHSVQLVHRADAVEIEMEDRQPPATIFVGEREGRAGDLPGEPETGGQSFRPMRLSCSEISDEREDRPRSGAFGSGST